MYVNVLLPIIGILFAGAADSPKPITLDPTVVILGAYDYVPYQSVPPFASRCVGNFVLRIILADDTR